MRMKRIAFSVDCADHEADNVRSGIESFLSANKLQYSLRSVDDIATNNSSD